MNRRTTLVVLAVALVATIAGIGVGQAQVATTGNAVVGSGFTVTPGDLAFILKQIKIAEHHAATLTPDNPCGTLVGPGPNQIPDRLTPYGLRTVDGSCNNLFPGREKYVASDVPFIRMSTPLFRDAEPAPPGFPAQASSSYKQKLAGNFVYDSQPRLISNLIVDQTSTNPAAVAAAGFPVRTQGNTGVFVCGAVGAPAPPNCTPEHKTLFIPNVTTDVGLSPPFNSMFTFFGQFFDHGVDQTVKSGGTVVIPLRADDPLRTVGPDGVAGTGDEVPANKAFMMLTRAQNQPGADGILGTADDIQDTNNTDTPLVDQSQTYTSHSAHQVFLREYVLNAAGRPVDTGKMLGGLNHTADAAGPLPGIDGRTGMSTWESTKQQARNILGLDLEDLDVTNIPMILADPYGNFTPGPHGFPQYVTKTGLVEGDPSVVNANGHHGVPVPANVIHFDTPFLTDIAHNAAPTDDFGNPLTPDADNVASADFAHQPAGTYDDEMLNAHFTCGDGRCNENIALSAVHQIFHSEHNRLVDYIKGVLAGDTSGTTVLSEWQLASGAGGWNGQRLFQAARFVTEMEYQHLVFEEFARKMVPAIRPFHVYNPDVNAAIPAEFAHAVYRFGHSMLDDDVARKVVDPVSGAEVDNNVPLLTAFLNPPEFFNGGPAGKLTPEQAAGSIFLGGVDLAGNEIDEFVTETLRNNLLGLPLDLPAINMARARDAGVPPLNVFRRQLFQATGDAQLTPYTSWADFGNHLKHPESLINFVAAYGKHPSITSVDTIAGKRDAARAIVNPLPTDVQPADASDFLHSTGPTWGGVDADGFNKTGLDSVDMWVGGLAEVTSINGPLLGSTFTYVFQKSLEALQDFDRFYYLNRTPGLNLRTQLEGNSFAEMVQRNTEYTHSFKADVFSTADCKFELGNLTFPTPSTVADDPSTPDCDESLLLTRDPSDGTIAYQQRNTVDPPGINGQSVYDGTPVVDRIKGGNDNDTVWGNDGDDVIDAQQGDDVVLGGGGNDKITDLDGADVLKGGPGNDYISAGPGDDVAMGGDGSDFIDMGANDNESFAGPGNDFVEAGAGADAPFGDGGDDWLEGGTGQDILGGDGNAAFFDDPGNILFPGNDIFVGQPGENDYDAEGGDDIMSQNAAIDRNAGAGGFDWAIHQYDTVGANDDMMINQNLGGLPIQVVVNRDRWQETEANSGSPFDDVIFGNSNIVGMPRLTGGLGFSGCDVLDNTGIDRIAGLRALIPPAGATGAEAVLAIHGDVNAPQADRADGLSVAALSVNGVCPQHGPFWGEGDIELGGGGSDSFTGRGGQDIIDGDKALHVRISVRNAANVEIGSTTLMEGQYLKDANGNPTGPSLADAVRAGTVDPGNLVVVREIVDEDPSDTGIDTSNYTGPLSGYTITRNADGSTTVCDNASAADLAAGGLHEAPKGDGCDLLWNIERIAFTDTTLNLGPVPVVASSPTAAAGLSLPDTIVGTSSATSPVTLTNTGTAPLTVSSLSIAGLDFSIASTTCLPGPIAAGASCAVNVRFTPQATGARSSSLVVSSNAAGSPLSIPLRGNGLAAPAFLAGNQAVEANADFNNAGTAEAFKTTAAATGNVSQVRVYVDAGNTATSVVAGVYANNTATSRPGALIARGTLNAPVAGQFNIVPVTAVAGAPSPNLTNGTTYWIAVLGPSGTLRFRDRKAVGTANSVVSSSTLLSTLPATWTSGAAFTDGALSGWAAGTITAAPPPPPPPAPGLSTLLGNGNVEAKLDSNVAGLAEAFKTTAITSGSVTRLRLFVDTGSVGNAVIGVYTNSATNHPGTLITQGTITAPTIGAFNDVTVPAGAVTSGTTYWIAVLGPTGTLHFRDRGAVGAGSSETSAQTNLTTLPATWTTGASFADGALSAVGLG